MDKQELDQLLESLGFDPNKTYPVPSNIDDVNRLSVEAFIRNQMEREGMDIDSQFGNTTY